MNPPEINIEARVVVFICGMAILAQLCAGCCSARSVSASESYRTGEGRGAFPEKVENMPEFDVYLTWTNYTGIEFPGTNAVYIWNGENVGVGDNGFDHVLSLLERLPDGSRILVFPSYPLPRRMRDGQFRDTGCGQIEKPPYGFGDKVGEFSSIFRKKRHVFLESNYDQNGYLVKHPDDLP